MIEYDLQVVDKPSEEKGFVLPRYKLVNADRSKKTSSGQAQFEWAN